MAFHFALTVLCVAAVCTSSLASPVLVRIVRAADPASVSSAAAKAQVQVQQQPQPQQFGQVKVVAPQAKAIVFAQPPVYQPVQISQPAPAGYQAIQVSAAPAPVPVASAKSAAAAAAVSNNVPNQQAQVTGQSYEFNPADNSYAYAFQTNNGISQQAKGYFNQNGKYVQEGSYTLYTPEGIPVSISYIADENGYQAVGDAIPQPDPVIAKAIAYQRSLPPSAENQA